MADQSCLMPVPALRFLGVLAAHAYLLLSWQLLERPGVIEQQQAD